MRLRRIPPTPERDREAPRELPDEITVRPFETAWGSVRYVIEARKAGRLLGDRAFPLYADALAFGNLEASYAGARLVDLTKSG